MVLPTTTSAGFVPMPSIVGHTFSVPETRTLPVRAGSWQESGTVTGVVWWPVMLNIPDDPPQVVAPSVLVAEIVIWYPLPAGMPLMVALRVVEFVRSMVPDFM